MRRVARPTSALSSLFTVLTLSSTIAAIIRFINPFLVRPTLSARNDGSASRSSGILIFVQSATCHQWTKGRNGRMSILPSTAIIRANQFNSNQSDIITFMVNEILRRLFLRGGWQLVILHFAPMRPVHAKEVLQPHTSTMPNARRRRRWGFYVL